MAALHGVSVPVRVVSSTTSSGLSLVAVTVAVVVTTATLSAGVVVIVIAPISITDIVLTTTPAIVTITSVPHAIALVSFKTYLYVQHAIEHFLHHQHGASGAAVAATTRGASIVGVLSRRGCGEGGGSLFGSWISIDVS